eukprot:9300958-Alexandrium_andersonii.AAC.1
MCIRDSAPCANKVSPVPELFTAEDCAPGDWLLLASDGVYDALSNETVQQLVDDAFAGLDAARGE